MGKMSRTKGHAWERRVAEMFRDAGFKDACTTRMARAGSWAFRDDGIDIRGASPFLPQCKRFKDYAPVSCIEEIVKYDGEIPVLITKKDHGPAMVVLPANEFFKLLKGYYGKE